MDYNSSALLVNHISLLQKGGQHCHLRIVWCMLLNIPSCGITYCLIYAKKTKRKKLNESKRKDRERNR